MKKLKVVTIVGTRPEIIRLSALIPKLDEFTDHVLVHTGQNSDINLNEVFFRDLELRIPDFFLNVDTSSLGSVMGDTIRRAEEVFRRELPDAVMILGDTNSAIAAVVAERMGIPVYHMEAGNRSFDRNVPEELNRKLVDHIASFNLPYNEYSAANLATEGIDPRLVSITGSPIGEIWRKYKDKISSSSVLERLGLPVHGYFLASIHRQENVDDPDRLRRVFDGLELIGTRYEREVVLSTHPRTRKRIEEFSIPIPGIIRMVDPFNYTDYSKLQLNSYCVISDSGTVSEESAIMGFPAITIRESMERPEALETGSIIMTGFAPEHVSQCVGLARSPALNRKLPSGYEVEDFSDRVVRFLFSTVRLHKKWANLN